MKINKNLVTNAFSNLSKVSTNKFWGFLAILHSINERVESNITYEIRSADLMSYLDSLFGINITNREYISTSVFVKLSMEWRITVSKQILKGKPNLLDCAAFYCRNVEFESSQTTTREIIDIFVNENKIKINGLIDLFDSNFPNNVIELENYNDLELANSISHEMDVIFKNGASLSLESPFFIQSRPSELKRAPFIQTLYSGDRIKELLLLSDTNLEILYPSNNTLIEEKVEPLENLEELFKSWLLKKYGDKSGTTNSYILSIKKISSIVSYNVFEEHDLDVLSSLLEEVKEKQGVAGSQFYIEDAPSYSTKGFLSASLTNYIDFLKDFENRKSNNGKNTIYYGAPGTGKSYKVDQLIKDLDPKFYQRVTFHPEFDNASFVGGYKPFSEKNNDGEDVISYKFVPQSFASIYADAWKDLDNDYYLVIEEINRGNCAEIFGEIFQLLDRNSNYTVSPSKELNDHLIEKFDNNKEHEGIAKGLRLPSNLHILATMNTSDQSLFPMDSAFKRRWEWEYVPICYEVQNEEGKSNESFNFEIDLGDGSKYKWIDFIAKINNNHIKNNQALGMDKCIGNYFIKPDNANNITLKPFINKVIFYLWNDVFKDEDNKVFESNGSYEDFFPILTNGLTKVKELFERIELTPNPAYPSREEEQDLRQVAEDNQPYGE